MALFVFKAIHLRMNRWNRCNFLFFTLSAAKPLRTFAGNAIKTFELVSPDHAANAISRGSSRAAFQSRACRDSFYRVPLQFLALHDHDH